MDYMCNGLIRRGACLRVNREGAKNGQAEQLVSHAGLNLSEETGIEGQTAMPSEEDFGKP